MRSMLCVPWTAGTAAASSGCSSDSSTIGAGVASTGAGVASAGAGVASTGTGVSASVSSANAGIQRLVSATQTQIMAARIRCFMVLFLPVSVSRAGLPVFTLYYAGTAHALQDILARMPKRVKNRLFFFETADFRAYSISAGGSRRVMLRRLTVSVYALCSSAEVAGGRMPATPRQISIKLKPMMFR